jgi:hypothetical protein
MDTIHRIKDHFKGFDQKYVYKKCSDAYSETNRSRKWLVVLKKTHDTKTNESRKVNNPKTAKYRGSHLKVVLIVDVNDLTSTSDCVVNIIYGIKATYTVGEIVYADSYDEEDIETVCSGGIHYFKTIEPAILYDILPTNFTGTHTEWSEQGDVISTTEYVEGKKMKFTKFHGTI